MPYNVPMASVQPIRPARQEPVSMHSHAMDNLKFIRETMERAGSFTAVPGWGGFAMGLSAIAASVIAARQSRQDAWLLTWLAEGVFAIALGALAMQRKANRAQVPLMSAPT